MKMFTLGLLAISLVVGCSPHVPTLDEEIANQPDEWGMGWQIGASSNNWALLARAELVEAITARTGRRTVASGPCGAESTGIDGNRRESSVSARGHPHAGLRCGTFQHFQIAPPLIGCKQKV